MILIISGPSAIGKDSLWITAAESLGFKRFCLNTTRPPRLGEIDGFDYHFVSRDRFRHMVMSGSLLDWDYYFYEYYGIDLTLVNKSCDSMIVMHSISRMAHRLSKTLDNVFHLGLVPENIEVLYERVKMRGEREDIFTLRKHHIQEEIDNSFIADKVIQSCESVDISFAKAALRSLL